MRYDVMTYARAFAAATANAAAKEEAHMVKNFVALIHANGDGAKLPQILGAAQKLILKNLGISKITIESARPLSKEMRTAVKKISGTHDVIEEKIDPKLIAGIRVIKNDEEQFDMSLASRLQKIFT